MASPGKCTFPPVHLSDRARNRSDATPAGAVSRENDRVSSLREEMSEQPHVLRTLLTEAEPAVSALADALTRRRPRAVVLVARGSSDHAATYGRYLFETRNGLLTSLAAPATVTLYGRGPDLADTCVIGISQSGQAEDVTAYLRRAREQGALTVAVVNDPRSPLANACEQVLDCAAGIETAIPATKTVTAQMLLLAMLSDRLALPADAEVTRSRKSLPDAVEAALKPDERLTDLAQRLSRFDDLSILGRGYAYPMALELALKIKEMVRLHASAYSSADFLHGPVTLAGPQHAVLVLDAGERSSAAAAETLQAILSRSTEAFLLRAGRPGEADSSAAMALPCDLQEHHAAIALLVLGQRLAFEIALARGEDPERPPGLRKVTRTR